MKEKAKSIIAKPFFKCKCVIWLLGVCLMVFVFLSSRSPIYTEQLVNSMNYLTAPTLYPGDAISQSFHPLHDNLTTISIAFDYEENVPEDTSVLIEISHNGQEIVEEALNIHVFPRLSFMPLSVNLKDCRDDEVTLRITNTTETSDESASFSLMSTDKEILFPENASRLSLNGSQEELHLLSSIQYLTGATLYLPFTHAFWVFITTLLLSRAIPHLCSLLPRNRNH